MPKLFFLSKALYRLAGVFLVLLALCACQSLPVQPKLSSEGQNQRLQTLNKWHAKGKIALTYKDDRQSASFTWKQDKNDFDIHLFGPMGQGSTWLRKNEGGISLESSEQNHQAATPEELMEQALGWQVPVSNLQYWMKGMLAASPVRAISRDENGFITSFVQDGWKVRYVRQVRIGAWLMPEKLVIVRKPMKLTVIVKNWSLNQ